MDAYKTLVGKLNELPSQPAVLRKLQALISGNEVSSHQAAEIIELDQGFTARILRLVNSPFYGFTRMIVSVEEAITMLGFNAVHQLLLTSSLLKSVEWQGHAAGLHAFWKHSFGVGVLAKHLLTGLDKHAMDEAFVGGIMHDVGRLVYIKTDANKYAQFQTGAKKVAGLDEEREYFGADHQVLGELLAEKWNFPESVRTIIACHHSPLNAGGYKHLAAAVNLADLVAKAAKIGDGGSYYVDEFYPETWTLLNMTPEIFENAIGRSFGEIAQTEGLLKELH